MPTIERGPLPRARFRLPGIVAFILRSGAVGAAGGAVLAAAFLAGDVAGLGTLVAGASDPVSPVLLLGLGFATLIGSLYAGAAIMLLPAEADDQVWHRLADPGSVGERAAVGDDRGWPGGRP